MPEYGVMHRLNEHAVKRGFLNDMLKIRNDLISNAEQQDAMAAMLSTLIVNVVDRLAAGSDQCRA